MNGLPVIVNASVSILSLWFLRYAKNRSAWRAHVLSHHCYYRMYHPVCHSIGDCSPLYNRISQLLALAKKGAVFGDFAWIVFSKESRFTSVPSRL